MQFSIISLVAALAATASASVASNGTSTAFYPTGTGASTVTGTAAPVKPTSTVPFVGGAERMAGSAFGLIVAGGVALMF